jgi:3-oxoacyl-(acyl-carrier-protein) synthase
MAVQNALKDAEVGANEIDAISAHGNSVPHYDIAETNAYKNALGRRAYYIPVHSIKSMIGNALAASGIFQAISSCLTIRNSLIPPTINHEIPDSDCDLDYVPNTARAARVNRILLSARSMGGAYTILVLGKVGAS